IFDNSWLVPSEHISHSLRFKLEHTGSKPGVKDFFVGLAISEGQSQQIEFHATRLLDEAQCVFKNCERGKPKKIHLEQTNLLNRLHVECCDDFVVLRLMQRNEIR